ncbi:MAG: hypothetical protein R3C05_06040 [Pirellulaceae bacterium]
MRLSSLNLKMLPIALCFATFPFALPASEPIDIGNRLELFVDDAVIESTNGDVRRELRKPEPREVVLVTDESWEGNTSGYFTLFRDGDVYRMVYRGWQHDPMKKAVHKELTCYAESKDGVKWVKPKLGLVEWNGSKENNLIWSGVGTHNFTPFRDDNPATNADARYKAFGGLGSLRGGLIPFQSPDCVNWEPMREQPVITDGAFDSQNLAFWDSDRNEYRAYWRSFSNGVRAIRTATSNDFINWSNQADLTYPEGTPVEHLYTNAIQKYFRAPHLFIGFPTRYEPKSQEVEPVLMTSRDGVAFTRFADPVIPRTAPKDRNHNRSNYMAWGMFQLPGQEDEISVYATENYYESTPGRLRRFVYRVDGFVALKAGGDGGTMTTKRLTFTGDRLLLNYIVHAGGEMRVEALDESGQVIRRSKVITGDAIDAAVEWEQTPDFSKAVDRLRFHLTDAEVYALRFAS